MHILKQKHKLCNMSRSRPRYTNVAIWNIKPRKRDKSKAGGAIDQRRSHWQELQKHTCSQTAPGPQSTQLGVKKRQEKKRQSGIRKNRPGSRKNSIASRKNKVGSRKGRKQKSSEAKIKAAKSKKQKQRQKESKSSSLLCPKKA